MIQDTYIHKNTVINSTSSIGYFAVIGENSSIGAYTNIGEYACISENVIIGDRCTIGDMVTICENVEIGDDTHIEPGVVFMKKLNPRAFDQGKAEKTFVGKNVTIQAKSVIESGCSIEDASVIKYGTVLKKNSQRRL